MTAHNRSRSAKNGAPLHLVKLSVGSDSVETLRCWQRERQARHGKLFHRTRMMPRRVDDVLDGGSIYWVIKGIVRCRQRILGFERVVDGEGRADTHILLDPALVPTWPQPCRAFQGWRYLKPQDVPADLEQALGGVEGDVAEMPAQMLVELRALGLL